MSNIRSGSPSAISAEDLAKLLKQGEPLVLLDVRRPDERALCAIPVPETAVDLFIPMDEIPGRLAEIEANQTSGTLVVYCHHGVRSQMVADWMAGQKVANAVNLRGGIDAWSRSVDPALPRY